MPLKCFKKCVSLGSQTDAVEEIDAVTIRSVTGYSFMLRLRQIDISFM